MLTTSVLAVLSTLLVVNAQTNPQLEVESIRAQFYNAYLVPDLLATFDPSAYLTVKFAAGDISAGTPLAVSGKFQKISIKSVASARQCQAKRSRPLLRPTPGAQ